MAMYNECMKHVAVEVRFKIKEKSCADYTVDCFYSVYNLGLNGTVHIQVTVKYALKCVFILR